MFACVAIDWNGHRVYTSFHNTAAEAIAYAERSSGVIAVERAHAGQPPIWTR